MKTFILFCLLLAGFARGGTITCNGLTYGTEQRLVQVGWSDEVPLSLRPGPDFVDQMLESKVHPLDWHQGLDCRIDLIWIIGGPLDKIEAEARRHPTANWVWSGAFNSGNRTDVSIDLDQKGLGRLHLWQKGVRVGHCRCRSSEDPNKRPIGRHTVLQKNFTTHDGRPARVSGEGSNKVGRQLWMYYACMIDAKRGFFLHGGNQATPTGGCIRIPFHMDRYVWTLLSVGSHVNITQV